MDITRWMQTLAARGEPPPIEGGGPLMTGDDVVQVCVEVYRKRAGSTAIAEARRVGAPPSPPDLDGWELRADEDGWSAKRGLEELTAYPSDGLVTVSWRSFDVPHRTVDETLAELARLPDLAVFGEIAEAGGANVRSWGVGRDVDRGTIGLVTLDVSPERLHEVYEKLASKAFREVEEGRWDAADGERSVIAMGATLYGYRGPIPLSVGGMAPSPRSRSDRVMRLLLRLRDAAAPHLSPDDREDLEIALRHCCDDADHARWVGRVIDAARSDEVRALGDDALALMASARDR